MNNKYRFYSEASSDDRYTKEEYIKACMEYAKGVLKDKYDEGVTKETASGIYEDHPDSNNGQLMGIFKYGLRGNKQFSLYSSSLPISKDATIINRNAPTQATSAATTQIAPVKESINVNWSTSDFNLGAEPWLVANCITGCLNGVYFGQLATNTLELPGGKRITIDVSIPSAAPIRVLAIIFNKKIFIYRNNDLALGTKSFSADATSYSFGIYPEASAATNVANLIGTWAASETIMHLYHLCETNKDRHVTLDDYHKGLYELVDSLAEAYLLNNDIAFFHNLIDPTDLGADIYLSKLIDLTEAWKTANADSEYIPYFDDILKHARAIQYKLIRLTSGSRSFSFYGDKEFTHIPNPKDKDWRDKCLSKVSPKLVENLGAISEMIEIASMMDRELALKLANKYKPITSVGGEYYLDYEWIAKNHDSASFDSKFKRTYSELEMELYNFLTNKK